MPTLGHFNITAKSPSRKTDQGEDYVLCDDFYDRYTTYVSVPKLNSYNGENVNISQLAYIGSDDIIEFYLQYNDATTSDVYISLNKVGGPYFKADGNDIKIFDNNGDSWRIGIVGTSNDQVYYLNASTLSQSSTTTGFVRYRTDLDDNKWWLNYNKSSFVSKSNDLYLDKISNNNDNPITTGRGVGTTCNYTFNFIPLIATSKTYNIVAQSTETDANTISIKESIQKNGGEEFLTLEFYNSICDFDNECTPKRSVGSLRVKRHDNRKHTILNGSGIFSNIKDKRSKSFYLKEISDGYFLVKFPGHAFIISDKINTSHVKNRNIINKINKKYNLHLKIR